MPDQALIEQVEDLRELVAQRQRLATGLQTALKGLSAALGKAGRTLREYAERGGASPEIERAQEAFGTLRLRDVAIDPLQPDLRREVKQLAAVATALKDAGSALRSESVDVARLGHALQALRQVKLNDARLAALLPALESELDQAQAVLGDTFGLALRHALAAQGVSLGGRPPRFEIGPFELTADFVRRAASLSYGKNLVRQRIPLSVEAVIGAYQRESRAIIGRDEDPARWIEALFSAWEQVRRRRGSSEPRANIVECYLELVLMRQPRVFRSAPSKSAFVEYSRAQFAYDFFTFTNQHPVLHNGLRAFGLVATRSQTENPERSLWIVEGDSPHEGRYIADVKFDRDA